MATLTSTKIKDTYKSLLKVSDNGNLEAGLQDITDGEGNASGVQLNTGGDLTASGTVAFGSLKDSGEDITIAKFVDEADGIAANDNDTSIPTSAAVKDYVDTKVTAEDLDFAGDSGTGSVDLDSQTFTIAGTANEIETSASGQTITIGLPSTITANVNGNVTGDLTGTVLTAAQTNITSVGTLSSLAVSGNLTVDTNTLFVDAANNWVGIGTSSPSRPIHILAPTPGIKLEDTTGNDFGEIVSVDGDLFLRADEGATQADSSIRFQIDQSEKVRITSGGNVGIDSSNPSEKLDINGNIILKSGYKLYGNANAGSTSSYVSLYNAVDGGIDLMANFASSKITFGTAGTEAMRILSNGRVGIGTNSPAELLEVEGNIRGRSFYVDSGATGKGYDFAVSGSGAGTANMFCPSGFTIGFGTNSIERMRIDASGNVGIGQTTEALAKLAVYGGRLYVDSTSEYTIRISNTGAVGGFIGTPASGALGFYGSTGTERMRITSSGNVSIASGILELAAQAKIIGSSDNLQISADPNNVSGASTIEFLVDGSERMRINSSGNVGIGSSSPSTTIHVNSGATNEVATFESTDSTAIVTIKDNTAKTELSHSGDNFSIQVDPDNTGAASSFIINMDGTEKLRMHPQYLRLASGTGGIQFNGDTAAANALDDYEEGTWSPVYVPTSGSFATMTMDVLNATYTKIGRLVTIVVQIRTDDVDVTGASGNVLISGLPYTAVLSSGGGGAISVGFTSDFVNAPTAGGFTNNGTTIILRVGTTPMAVADLTDGTSANENTLYFAASYFTS
jgi:hypothetical protein